jgi:hypothetical protein
MCSDPIESSAFTVELSLARRSAMATGRRAVRRRPLALILLPPPLPSVDPLWLMLGASWRYSSTGGCHRSVVAIGGGACVPGAMSGRAAAFLDVSQRSRSGWHSTERAVSHTILAFFPAAERFFLLISRASRKVTSDIVDCMDALADATDEV